MNISKLSHKNFLRVFLELIFTTTMHKWTGVWSGIGAVD